MERSVANRLGAHGLAMVLPVLSLLVPIPVQGGGGWSKAVANYLYPPPVNRLTGEVHAQSSALVFRGEPSNIPSGSATVNDRAKESLKITALPSELVVNVLANLSIRDLLVCKHVCKNWQALVTTVPALACAAYRSCHPIGYVPSLNDAIKSYHGSLRQWLNSFSEQGRTAVTELDGILDSGGLHFPEQLFFAIAWVLDTAQAFDCRTVCTIEHPHSISGAGFSPNQQHLLSYSSHTIHICNFVDGGWQCGGTFWQASRVTCAYFSPDSRYLVALLDNGRAKIWALADGRWQQQDDWSPVWVRSFPVFNADTTHLMTISSNDKAHIHRVMDGKWQRQQVTVLNYHPVWGGRFHPKEPNFFATYCQNTVTLWRAVDGQWQESGRLLHAHEVSDIKFSPDGSRLMVHTTSSVRAGSVAQVSIHIWCYGGKVDKMGREWRKEAELWPTYPEDTAHFSLCGHYILTSPGQSCMEIWHLLGGQWKEIKTPLLKHCISGHFSPDEHHLATQNWICNAVTWTSMDELLHGEIATPYHAPWPTTRFSPHGNHLVAANGSEIAMVWGICAGIWQVKATLPHTGELHTLRFSPHGNYVLTTTRDGTINVWILNGQQ